MRHATSSRNTPMGRDRQSTMNADPTSRTDPQRFNRSHPASPGQAGTSPQTHLDRRQVDAPAFPDDAAHIPRARRYQANFRMCNVRSAVFHRSAPTPGTRRSDRWGGDTRGRPRNRSRDNSCSAGRPPGHRVAGPPPLSTSRAPAATATRATAWISNQPRARHTNLYL